MKALQLFNSGFMFNRGTYIRSLANDFGQHWMRSLLSSLRRTDRAFTKLKIRYVGIWKKIKD